MSNYHLMVLETIGLKRFLLKPYFKVKKKYFFYSSQLFGSKNLNSFSSNVNNINYQFIGNWLYGSKANLNFIYFKNQKNEIIQKATLAKNGIFHINGKSINIYEYPYNGRLDVDPISGKKWPNLSIFSNYYNYIGDIRFPWELGRLHQLVWFGQAWRYTKNPIWIKAGLDHIDFIFNDNSFEHGVHWFDGLQVSVRIFSIIAFADLCHDYNDKSFFQRLFSVVNAHSYTLKRQFSPLSEISNNHIIGESCALVLSGIFLNNPSDIKKGLKRLKFELQIQIYSDGVPYEGSIPYIRFVLDFLTLTFLSLQNSKNQIPLWLTNYIKKVASALANLTDYQGRIPPIGDGDDARVIRFDSESYLNVNESLHLASKILHLELAPSVSSHKFSFWAAGINDNSLKKTQEITFLQESGLFHFSCNKLDIWVDCGPTGLGLKGPGGHGHNDTTAIVVHLDGKALLHDPGWHNYFSNLQLRNILRSTLSHNTININNQEQASIGGLFEIKNECQPTKTRVRKFKKIICLECGHNGYKRINNKIFYSRVILIKKNHNFKIRVIDCIRSKYRIDVKSYIGSNYDFFRKSNNHWKIENICNIYFYEGFENIIKKLIQYSEQTGVIKNGTALEWKISEKYCEKMNVFFYKNKWEITI